MACQIDERHQAILSPQLWGDGDPEGVRQRAAAEMGRTAEARLKGQKLPAKTIIPSVLITKDNAKDFYFPDSPF